MVTSGTYDGRRTYAAKGLDFEQRWYGTLNPTAPLPPCCPSCSRARTARS